MRRALAVALALLLVVPSAAVAVPDARLAVSGLTVSPDISTVGEPVTVTATVRNSAGSDSAVELTAVRLVDGDGTTLATAGDPGSLSPGDTLSVDLTRQFETSGVKELAVVAVGEDANDQRVTIRRPVTVTVEQTPPLVAVDAPRLVTDSENRLAVQVSNPNAETYRNLVVRIDAPDAGPKRRVVPSLAGGASTTLNVSYAPAETGAATVGVTVDYTTATGVDRRTESATTLSVESLREDVGVAVEPAPEQQVQANPAGNLGGILGGAGGSTLQQSGQQESSGPPDALSVTVTNFGNAPIRNAVVVPRTDDGQLPRVAVVRDTVLERHIMGPQALEAWNPNLVGGDINGGALDLRQLIARPVLRWTPYRVPARTAHGARLYMASASTPPGGGVHGMAGRHAARTVLADAQDTAW